MRNPFKPKVITKEIVNHIHHRDDNKMNDHGSKFGRISYNTNFSFGDESARRDIARKVYRESLTAKGMTRRFVDSVVNVGMSWESTPLWDMITDSPGTPEEKRQWTVDIENRWKLYSTSKEADTEGVLTFQQLQRMVYKIGDIDGEVFGIIRYMSDARRISNVALQIINNDQITSPHDGINVAAIKARGAKVVDGVEFDNIGREVAIWVQEGFGAKHTRIAYFGGSGRRFVIHYKANPMPGESRGVPEFASLAYELSRLTEVEINEIEKMASASTWMGVVKTDKDAYVKKPDFLINSDQSETTESTYTPGIDTVHVGDKALIMNNLEPGQDFQMFKSDYTNTNLETLIEVYETRVAASRGMSLSVYKLKFDASYNASRSAILFYWNNVLVRRDDLVSGFLNVFMESVITEWIKIDTVKAPGFMESKMARMAWLFGSWNGINRPSVDPVKDATGSKMRREMGDETGERGAKAYNGSDWRENVEKLSAENELLAAANEPLQRQDNTTVSESIQVDPSEQGGQSNVDRP
jgi:lambda family phage portal protein